MNFKEILRILSHKVKVIHDWSRGLDFLNTIMPEEVGFDRSIVYRSSPSSIKSLKALLGDINISGNDSILDIGCGKGNAMRCMLDFPFSKIDGVEISEHIAGIAKRNFRKLNATGCTVFNCNASSFENYGDYNIYFLYNPFPAEVMSMVIDKIIQSIVGETRERSIIYNNPKSRCHDVIIKQGIFRKIEEYPDACGHPIYIYSNRGAGRGAMNE